MRSLDAQASSTNILDTVYAVCQVFNLGVLGCLRLPCEPCPAVVTAVAVGTS